MDDTTFTDFMNRLYVAPWTVHNATSNTKIFKTKIAHELIELYTTDIDGLLYINNEKPVFTDEQKGVVDDFIQSLLVSLSGDIADAYAQRDQNLNNSINSIINS